MNRREAVNDPDLEVARIRGLLGDDLVDLDLGDRVLARVLNRVADAAADAAETADVRETVPRRSSTRWHRVLAAAAVSVGAVTMPLLAIPHPVMATPRTLIYSIAAPTEVEGAPTAAPVLLQLASLFHPAGEPGPVRRY